VSLFDWLRPEQPPHRPVRPGARECRRCLVTLPDAARFCFICGREVEGVAAEPWLEEPRAGGSYAELQARLTHTLDGRYKVREILGAGGMGVVFLADDLALGRAVAIKVLPPEVSGDETVVSRFRREAKTAARLDHPGIIPIYRVENEGGLDYFIMKYVAGRSLDAVLRDEAPLSIPFAARVLREASAALAHAHRHGVVHRDVKPANIMLDADERVVLTDFGISRASFAEADATTEPRLTEVGTAIGTPQYMAPEQAVGQAVDGRADQYALAIVGFEMLAGQVPFDDETPHAIIHRQISEAPPDLAALRPDAPAHMTATIAKALRKSPQSRFATMEEFLAALDDPAMSPTPATRTRAIGIGQTSPTRALIADDRELDTALARVFDPAKGSARSTRSVALWMGSAVLLIAALAGGLWARGHLRPSVSSPQRVARAETRAGPVTQRSTTQRPVAQQGRSKETRRRTTTLGITATPRATVYIDGARIGETPISGRTLTVGRSYQIRVERKGYRTKRETIEATSTKPIRRSYTLQRDPRR
jgi:serine/threonine protein kinase